MPCVYTRAPLRCLTIVHVVWTGVDGDAAARRSQGVDIAAAYESGTESDCNFIQRLALFFTGYFKVPRRPILLSHIKNT